MYISIDRERVELVLGTLLDTYREKRYIYGLPSARLPHEVADLERRLELGSVEHAMFLFVLCLYMKGGIKSNTAAKQLARLYSRRPRLFDADEIVKIKPESITASLERVDLRYLKNSAPPHWIENAQRLLDWYDGDPRKIFVGVGDYDEACRRIRNKSRRHHKTKQFTHRQGFMGFQHKMVSMLMYFYIASDIIEPIPFPIPVDFHVMRVCIETEMVNFSGDSIGRDIYSEHLQTVLRDLFTNYCVRHGVSPIELCNAVWLLSSVGCAKNPGNRTLSRLYRARRTETPAYTPVWSDSELARYEQFCGACPVGDMCHWDVPNSAYTIKGELMKLRPRSTPPQ
jgi:endonuclease III